MSVTCLLAGIDLASFQIPWPITLGCACVFSYLVGKIKFQQPKDEEQVDIAVCRSGNVPGDLQQMAECFQQELAAHQSSIQQFKGIVDELRNVPQKFIVFVDDLSFEEDNDAFKSLKVVLEGNVTARAKNVVVYATSNRRHLIREFFDDRPRPQDADEIHNWDTVQEKLSFSDRFGLTLTFQPANQDTYLNIVHHLASQIYLKIDKNDLEFKAKQWATQHNGRSGRTARQFIDFLRGELELNH